MASHGPAPRRCACPPATRGARRPRANVWPRRASTISPSSGARSRTSATRGSTRAARRLPSAVSSLRSSSPRSTPSAASPHSCSRTSPRPTASSRSDRGHSNRPRKIPIRRGNSCSSRRAALDSSRGGASMKSRSFGLAVLAVVLVAITASAQQKMPGPDQLGTVTFSTSCTPAAQEHFTRGVALLHSFWLDAAVKAFGEAAQADPGCGIAYWGAAMAWMGNPLAGPPSARGLKEGATAVQQAKAAGARTQRERDWIAAIDTIYTNADTVDHRTRAVAYEKAMEQLAARYPNDREAAVFYALALNMTLNPNDK